MTVVHPHISCKGEYNHYLCTFGIELGSQGDRQLIRRMTHLKLLPEPG